MIQCLNATTALTTVYLLTRILRIVIRHVNLKRKPNILDNDGWITVASHDPKKNKKNKESNKEKRKPKQILQQRSKTRISIKDFKSF